MPIFEFRCPSCETTFERLVRVAEKVNCPSCGSRRVEKLLSVPARPASSTPAATPSCESMPQGGCCGGGMCQLN